MTKVAKLKKDFILRINELQRQHLNKEEQFFVEIFPKRVIIKYKNKKMSERAWSVEIKNVERLQKSLFLQCNFLTSNENDNLKICDLNRLLFKTIVSYWIDYANLKEDSLFIDIYNKDASLTQLLEQCLLEMGFINSTKYSQMFDCEHICLSNVYGYIDDKKEQYLSDALNFHLEFNDIRKKDPTFYLDSYDYEIPKGFFKIERQNYYYRNSIFKITPSQYTLFVEGEDIPKKEFIMKRGALQEILSYIKEQMMLPNLLTPPIRHFSQLLVEQLRINEKNLNFEEKYAEIEAKIEKGQLEIEAAYIIDTFKKSLKKSDNTLTGDFKEIQANLLCKIYKVKTPNLTWYIIANLEINDFWMIPTKEQEKTPEEVVNILVRYLEGKCLKET